MTEVAKHNSKTDCWVVVDSDFASVFVWICFYVFLLGKVRTLRETKQKNNWVDLK